MRLVVTAGEASVANTTPSNGANRAVHAVDELPKNCGDIVELTFAIPSESRAAESIYVFDQGIATTGIRYQAELRGSGYYCSFAIRVPASVEPKVKAIIAQIMRR